MSNCKEERPAKIATPATTSKKGVRTAMLIIFMWAKDYKKSWLSHRFQKDTFN